MKGIYLKVDEHELENWRTEAKQAGCTLSAWIRHRCLTFGSVTKESLEVLKNELPIIPTFVSDRKIQPGNYDEASVVSPKIWNETQDRKPCKHGLLFCKKCA